MAGTCFILPAAAIVLVFAALYARYGTMPAAESLLYGITPVVKAIVAHALWCLMKTAVMGWSTAAIGAAALVIRASPCRQSYRCYYSHASQGL